MACAWDFQFRVLLLGDSGVGKSALLLRYTEDVFADAPTHTVGVDFCSQEEEPEPGVRVRLQFWDTAGQERYRAVTRSYYRNAAAVVLLFDLTARRSFESIPEWHREVRERVCPLPLRFLLLGTKSDLRGQRGVTREEAQGMADALEAPYLETSARTGSNVRAALSLLCRELHRAACAGEYTPRGGWSGVPPAPLGGVETQEKQRRRCTC
ncbi:ras-related protein Rab-39B-like [Ascaphus truei]|uniref:ras-related protein Rab-39B-like n=1 Tax=Ascaphus truei TaxID=8439 RepID=UPI003F5993C7